MVRSRAVTVVLTGGALVAAAAFIGGVLWWFAATRGHPTPWDRPPVVDGRTVEVSYIGSACQDGSRLDLEEDSREVVVTVYAWQNAGSCDDLGVPYTLTGTLDAAPGDRVMIDGACRLDEYRDRDACRPR